MKFKNILLCSLLFISISCALFQKAQAPKANDTAKTMTSDLQKGVASFYTGLTNGSDKTYSGNQTEYSEVDNDLRALAVFDSARKHSTGLMIIVHDTENRFHSYEAEHKNYGRLNNAQIGAYKEGMDALLDILVRTENHYK